MRRFLWTSKNYIEIIVCGTNLGTKGEEMGTSVIGSTIKMKLKIYMFYIESELTSKTWELGRKNNLEHSAIYSNKF